MVEREKVIEKERREKEIFKTLSTLSMALSHELRNPLNTLNLIFEKISIEKDMNNVSSLAEKGEQEIERIKRFTKSFEMLLKKEAGEEENTVLAKEKIDLMEIISFTVKSLSETYKVNISIKEEGEKEVVIGDKELISILFYSLLKVSLEGIGEDGFMKIALNYEKNEITIKTNGKGIFSEDMFSHPKQGTKTNSKIGDTIFLVKKIIEFHKWEIFFNSYELGDFIIINFKKGDNKKNV